MITLRYELDVLLGPYLERLCAGVMVSVPELRRGDERRLPHLPLWVDSGGFAAFHPRAQVREEGGLGVLTLADGTRITPQDVADAQRRLKAAVSFTLDFPAPGTLCEQARTHRAALSRANALWALAQPRQGRLYACLQRGEDPNPLLAAGPDGIALGGCVPLGGDPAALHAEVSRVRRRLPDRMPLHVFGIGNPDGVRAVRDAGGQSTDSSGAQRAATAGRAWDGTRLDDPSAAERLNLALRNLQISAAAGRS